MSGKKGTRVLAVVVSAVALLWCVGMAAASIPAPQVRTAPLDAGVYKLVAWNDLGMHCMNESFANLAVLPPYNTLWAQLVRQGTNPQIITTGVTIEYSIIDNTYSAGKTDFWQYASQLFGVALQPNVGLAGATLSGTMHARGDYFIVEGVPLTPYLDSAPGPGSQDWYPYQRAHVVARDSASGQVLAETTTVAPVSTEMRCNTCHDNGKEPGGRTGKTETNILALHDHEEGTNLLSSQPVLCARCHASNALGAPGNPSLPNLSRAVHSKHSEDLGGLGSSACYFCHPGQQTQCLRDVMYAAGMTCTDCHGGLVQVANPTRRPWIDEPRCETCHGAQYAENAGLRYRDSKGHGGMYCESCHGSPHAILPTNQANDNAQNIALQGFPGTLRDCTVCHAETPAGPGPHGIVVDAPTATATRTASATAVSQATSTSTRTVTPSATAAAATPTATPADAPPTVTPTAGPRWMWLPVVAKGYLP